MLNSILPEVTENLFVNYEDLHSEWIALTFDTT